MSLDVYLDDDVCERCGRSGDRYSNNITHNLALMAEKAGIYYAMWRPEEKGITKASELIPYLEKGLQELEADPEGFKQYNPKNGWGSYDGLIRFVKAYIEACKAMPNAKVSVSR